MKWHSDYLLWLMATAVLAIVIIIVLAIGVIIAT